MDYLAQILNGGSEERQQKASPEHGNAQKGTENPVDASGGDIEPPKAEFDPRANKLFTNRERQVRTFGRRKR